MKIDGLLPEITIIKNQAGDSRVIDLEEGQVLNVRVLSYENGNAVLKSEEGYILRAKLDTGIVLEQGSNVTLVVAEQSNGVFVLKLNSEISDGQMSEPISINPNPVHRFTDELPEKINHLLNELDLPSTKVIIVHIQKLIKQNPHLSPEKIIFLAMNDMEAGEFDNILKENNGMVKTLRAFMDMIKAGILDNLQNTDDAGVDLNAATIPGNEGENPAEPIAGMTVLSRSPRAPMQTSGSSTMHVLSLESEYNIDEEAFLGAGGVNETKRNQVPSREIDQLHVTSEAKTGSLEVANSESLTIMDKLGDVLKTMGIENAEKLLLENIDPTVISVQTPSKMDVGTQRLLMSLLSRMPALEKEIGKEVGDIKESILNAFVQVQALKNSGERVAEESGKFIDNLFVKLVGDQTDGVRLKRAREELYTKLYFLREALPGMELNHKVEMLELTQKLMGHMQTVSGIEQFVYMQIPAWLSGEHTEAELYIFKKRHGTRKIDPDNIKILLALNLTNIGHIESLIGIRGKEVSLCIEVSEKSYESIFIKKSIKLHKMLAEVGYKLVNISVKQLKREVSVETAMFKLMDLERGRKSGLDLTI